MQSPFWKVIFPTSFSIILLKWRLYAAPPPAQHPVALAFQSVYGTQSGLCADECLKEPIAYFPVRNDDLTESVRLERTDQREP